MNDSSKIKPVHTQRAALVYVRQSSLSQVEHNRESTARQYALADRACQSATTCTAGGMMKGPRGALRLMKRAKALQMAIALAFFPPPLDSECTLESPVHLIQLC
jgi:hypothetical protein